MEFEIKNNTNEANNTFDLEKVKKHPKKTITKARLYFNFFEVLNLSSKIKNGKIKKINNELGVSNNPFALPGSPIEIG